ncbi:hypothetical protein SAMN04489707_102371 [Paenacidovorax caeni]|uniref:Uncharacterized protein n=1 Tax=Paenacidovorax caeni TaxID=343013 RepID=A0A1I7J9L4_9BURK|nr:hypothetical protein SAMN04489707_102371 [Paenacidovorax caeni]
MERGKESHPHRSHAKRRAPARARHTNMKGEEQPPGGMAWGGAGGKSSSRICTTVRRAADRRRLNRRRMVDLTRTTHRRRGAKKHEPDKHRRAGDYHCGQCRTALAWGQAAQLGLEKNGTTGCQAQKPVPEQRPNLTPGAGKDFPNARNHLGRMLHDHAWLSDSLDRPSTTGMGCCCAERLDLVPTDHAATHSQKEVAPLRMGRPLRFCIDSCWRLMGGRYRRIWLGFSQLWPDQVPVVRAQVPAGYRAVRGALDGNTVLNGNRATTVRPLPNQLRGHPHLGSERRFPPSLSGVVIELHASIISASLI